MWDVGIGAEQQAHEQPHGAPGVFVRFLTAVSLTTISGQRVDSVHKLLGPYGCTRMPLTAQPHPSAISACTAAEGSPAAGAAAGAAAAGGWAAATEAAPACKCISLLSQPCVFVFIRRMPKFSPPVSLSHTPDPPSQV